MEKIINRIVMRVIYRENIEIEENYAKLMPFSEKELENIHISESCTEGLFVKEIIITKNALINSFFKNLLKIMSHEKHIVKDVLINHLVPPHFDLFIRLKKEDLSITDSGDCFHMKISVAAYPRTEDAVKKKILELFK